jgi:thiol-disulfide isomerase/thioredoxin
MNKLSNKITVSALLFMLALVPAIAQKAKAPVKKSVTTPAKIAAPTAAPVKDVDGFSLIGKPVPDVTLLDFEKNQPVQLSKFKGKLTIITFWATWCGPCIKEMPAFSKLVEDYQGKLQVIAIATGDDRTDTLAFKNKHSDYQVTWLLDPDWEKDSSNLAKSFGIIGLPTNLFIDADGKVVDYWRGLENTEALVKKVQELMAK